MNSNYLVCTSHNIDNLNAIMIHDSIIKLIKSTNINGYLLSFAHGINGLDIMT